MNNWKRLLLFGVGGSLFLTCVALSVGLMTAVTSASFASLTRQQMGPTAVMSALVMGAT
jgi:hypothetical protein